MSAAPIKRRSRLASFTENAEGFSFKFSAALAIFAVTALIAIVPFLIAIMNAVAPAARISATSAPLDVTTQALPTSRRP